VQTFATQRIDTISLRAQTFWELRLLLLGSLVVALLGTCWTAPTAHAASCGGDKCYGDNTWVHTSSGVSSTFKTVTLYSITGGGNHISDEMWLIDYGDNCSGGRSWLEAGLATQPGHTGYYYFWAECRPGATFLTHFLYQPPSGDVGNYFYYYIYTTSTLLLVNNSIST
jgi:hypothetical protein